MRLPALQGDRHLQPGSPMKRTGIVKAASCFCSHSPWIPARDKSVTPKPLLHGFYRLRSIRFGLGCQWMLGRCGWLKFTRRIVRNRWLGSLSLSGCKGWRAFRASPLPLLPSLIPLLLRFGLFINLLVLALAEPFVGTPRLEADVRSLCLLNLLIPTYLDKDGTESVSLPFLSRVRRQESIPGSGYGRGNQSIDRIKLITLSVAHVDSSITLAAYRINGREQLP